jgi:hypothetical protein
MIVRTILCPAPIVSTKRKGGDMSRTYTWDDTYCPEGHGAWVFIPAATLYSDIYWCRVCDCFYQPTVKRVTYDKLNREFSSDRAEALRQRGAFLAWKANLSPKDMPSELLESV